MPSLLWFEYEMSPTSLSVEHLLPN
jgi:hypothetical protein